MRVLGVLLLFNLGVCSLGFKLFQMTKKIKDRPKGFGTAKHAVIIGMLVYRVTNLLAFALLAMRILLW